MPRLYLDTESTGLMGPLNLVQIGDEDGRVIFIRPYKEQEKMEGLRNSLMNENFTFVGYNVQFDAWKLYQFYGQQEAFECKFIDLLHRVKTSPPFAPFLKKKSVVKLADIDERVAGVVGEYVCGEIQKLVPQGIEIKVKTSKKRKGFVDLSFRSEVDAKLKTVISSLFPEEREYLKKIRETGWDLPDWKEKGWLGAMEKEKEAQYYLLYLENEKILDIPSSPFLAYARRDIEYLFFLDKFFKFPAQTDDDVCSEIVAFTRFRGFEIDAAGLEEYKKGLEGELEKIEKFFPGVKLLSPKERKKYLNSKFNLRLKGTGKKSLEKLKRDLKFAINSSDLFVATEMSTAVNAQSAQILKEVEKIEKYNGLYQRKTQAKRLLEAGKFYPDFVVIGTQSGRMAGKGGINTQGIDRGKEGIRKYIKLSQGGDFDSLELNLAAYLYDDKMMQDDLCQIDMHLNTGLILINSFLPLSYAEAKKIKENKGHPLHEKVKAVRQAGKTINFSMLYFCSDQRVQQILEENEIEGGVFLASEIRKKFLERYVGISLFSKKAEKKFCTLNPDSWFSCRADVDKMATRVENCFGYTRNFEFEKLLCQLFVSDEGIERTAQKECERLKIEEEKIVRKKEKGEQLIFRSILSARLGAILNIQSAVFRAAGNHIVQSSGAQMTKKLMGAIWKRKKVALMNVHDEVNISPEYSDEYEEIKKIVEEFLESQRSLIPTLSMSWDKMSVWADKK